MSAVVKVAPDMVRVSQKKKNPRNMLAIGFKRVFVEEWERRMYVAITEWSMGKVRRLIGQWYKSHFYGAANDEVCELLEERTDLE